MAATINREVGGEYGPRHIDFFKGLVKRFQFPEVTDPPTVKLFEGKKEMLNFIQNRSEPQHLIYFFCHHKKGQTKDELGWYRIEDTKLVLRGSAEGENAQEVVTVTELEEYEDIPEFEIARPVIFMNACESAQTEVGDPTSFMLYFISRLRAVAFVGTEALIPTAFADDFGQRFIKEFLSQRPIGQVILDARRHYAEKHYNPFGLFYTLYGNGNTRLSTRVEEVELKLSA